MGEKLVLLDGYSLMYRAFHALSTPCLLYTSTLLFVEHDMAFVRRVATRTVRLDGAGEN